MCGLSVREERGGAQFLVGTGSVSNFSQHPTANALFPLVKNSGTLTSMMRPGHLEVDLRQAFYL